MGVDAQDDSAPSRDFDFIVVGSGAGGLTGALMAAQAGLRTLVLEKGEFLGGMTAYAGGCMWLPGNRVTAAANPADSAEGGFTYLHGLAGDTSPVEMQRAYVDTAAELVEFLMCHPDLQFEYQPFPDYFEAEGRVHGGRGIFAAPLPLNRAADVAETIRPPVPQDRFGLKLDRTELVGGQALIGRLLLALRRHTDVVIQTGSRLTALILDGGRVLGVEAVCDGRTEEYRAARGVLLSAGGFEANQELRSQWQGNREVRWTGAPPTHTGDAIVAGLNAGAAIARMHEAWWAPMLARPDNASSFLVGFQGGIFVNGTGRRFGNESLPYGRMGQLILDLEARGEPALPIWWIFDDRFDTVPCAVVDPIDVTEFRQAGLWHTDSTVAGLARRIGLPPSVLDETVARFNLFAQNGVDDDFARGSDEYDQFFALPEAERNPCLIPIEKAPFHAVQIGLGDIGTKGGLVTNADGQVLDTDDRPIEGLYASGNTTASATGHVYAGPGAPIATSMVFAYRAARHAAEAST